MSTDEPANINSAEESVMAGRSCGSEDSQNSVEPSGAEEVAGAGSSTEADPGSSPPLNRLPPAVDMLAKIGAYVEGEAEMSLEDYRLLEAMNLAAAERYNGMADYSAGLVAFAIHRKAQARPSFAGWNPFLGDRHAA